MPFSIADLSAARSCCLSLSHEQVLQGIVPPRTSTTPRLPDDIADPGRARACAADTEQVLPPLPISREGPGHTASSSIPTTGRTAENRFDDHRCPSTTADRGH